MSTPPPTADTIGVADRSRPKGKFGRVVKRTLTGAWDDDIFTESASAAFWQTLSLPPLLLGLFGILGYVGDWFGPNTVDAVQRWIISTVGPVFSRGAVEQIIAPTVSQILTTARGEVISIGFLLSLWPGSSATSSFVDAITRAHNQYGHRNLVLQRLLSIGLYVATLVSGIVVLPIAAVGPDVLASLLPAEVQPLTQQLITTLSFPVVALVLVFGLTTLYKIALPVKAPWVRGLPGALLAAAVFLVGAAGLRAYLNWITGTGYTYGALAAPIAFLLATFFIAFAIILGAHLNAALEVELSHRTGSDLPAGGPAVVVVPEQRRADQRSDAVADVDLNNDRNNDQQTDHVPQDRENARADQ